MVSWLVEDPVYESKVTSDGVAGIGLLELLFVEVSGAAALHSTILGILSLHIEGLLLQYGSSRQC